LFIFAEVHCSIDPLSIESRPRSHCTGNGRSVGTVCLLTCLMGSRPKYSHVNRTCLANGSWTVPDAEWGCNEILNCPLSRITENPIGWLSSAPGIPPYSINSTIEDNLFNSKSHFATRTQHLNGKVSAKCTEEDMIGSICSLSCDKGYQLVGFNTR